MYNRYIGNTGKYYRIEDMDDNMAPPGPRSEAPPVREEHREQPRREETVRQDDGYREPREREAPRHEDYYRDPREWEPVQRDSHHREPSGREDRHREPLKKEESKKDSKWDLKNLSQITGNIRTAIKSKMPEGIDIGDILLVLVLLFLFLEGDDDEVLIVLGILVFTWVKPLFSKDKEDE